MRPILLVEDDPDQLEIRGLLIEAAGYTVERALGVAPAWKVFVETDPMVVVMDLRLPRVEDGVGLIRRMRAHRPAARILVLSGWTADFAALPEAALVDACLSKPVRSQQLLETIARLC